MFDVQAFLDRAKAAAGVESDYALGRKVLGYTTTGTVTNWRSGRSMPDERAIVKLCELTGDEPAFVAAQIQALRASSDTARELWERIAEMVKTAGHFVMLPAVLALVFIALAPEPARATALSRPFDAVALCIMSSAVLRLIWRLARLTYMRLSTPAAIFPCRAERNRA